MTGRRNDTEDRPAGGYARLRPARGRPQGVLALLAASRVGNWAPPLPPRKPGDPKPFTVPNA